MMVPKIRYIAPKEGFSTMVTIDDFSDVYYLTNELELPLDADVVLQDELNIEFLCKIVDIDMEEFTVTLAIQNLLDDHNRDNDKGGRGGEGRGGQKEGLLSILEEIRRKRREAEASQNNHE